MFAEIVQKYISVPERAEMDMLVSEENCMWLQEVLTAAMVAAVEI